jgi:hypothetical protein
MKLQRWSLFRGSLEATTNGPWAKASEAEALIDKLKCCGNCRHNYHSDEELCAGCCEPKLKKWEMRE